MRHRSSFACLLTVLAVAMTGGCGKRADPLAPYLKTPLPPSGLELSQVGEEIEIRVTAPRTTTENRPLPVIALEWYEGPASGDFAKTAKVILREDVAPGELRVKRFARPLADARFSVRASQGKARSTLPAPLTYTLAVGPMAPTEVSATNTAVGIELRWTNPPGAEPWPTPSASPLPSPTLTPGASPVVSPTGNLPPPTIAKGEAPTTTPAPEPLPSPVPTPTALNEPPPISGTPPVAKPSTDPVVSPGPPVPGASPRPSASPTPTPTPPTGIRIFRTDGIPRLAREPLQASSWIDTAPKTGDKPCYSLRYAKSFKPLVESAPTEPVCVDSKDIVPPEPPTRLIGDVSATFVELSWLASPSTDVAFYRIYTLDSTGHGTLLLPTDGPVLRVRDPNMTKGPRTYAITAVDKGGNESVLSPPLRVIVP